MSEKKAYGAPVFTELGRSGLRQSGGFVYEEFLRKLQWPKAGDIYQEMSSNDPVITAVLFCCRMLIRQVSWRVKACSDNPADVELQEVLDHISQIDGVDEVQQSIE